MSPVPKMTPFYLSDKDEHSNTLGHEEHLGSEEKGLRHDCTRHNGCAAAEAIELVTCRECWWMRYRPKSRIECRRLSRTLDDIDGEIDCAFFEMKEKDLKKIMESTERYYGEIGREYDEIWYSQRARRQYKTLYSPLERRIVRLLSKGALVLDAGCGTCEWSAFMVHKGASVVGLDRSSTMLELCKEKSLSQTQTQNFHLTLGDLSIIPFKEGAFDGVTAQFVLSHLLDDGMNSFLSELARVVKGEGWMLFVDTRLCEPHRRQEHLIRTLKSGKEYVIYKRYFVAEELKTFLERQLSRPFCAVNLESWVICYTKPSR
jgi:ubiquinone/menaquinone biosynthesis C-methylase UbiE